MDPDLERSSDEEHVERAREAVTMALYVGLSLLAVLVAVPSSVHAEGRLVVLTVALASVGLILAHQIAFRLSARLMYRTKIPGHLAAALGAQWLGGGAVTALAVVPLLIFGAGALDVSMWLLLGMVAIVGYLAVRRSGASRTKSGFYVCGLVIAISAVVLLKVLAA